MLVGRTIGPLTWKEITWFNYIRIQLINLQRLKVIWRLSSSESDEAQKKRFLESLKIISEFENPWKKDFDNPKRESIRLFSEVLGTFFLVLVAVGGNVVYFINAGTISPFMAVVAPGLMVMVVILFMGNVSGAHLNPVVSIAFAARGDFPWRRVPGYIIAQLTGSIIACLFLFLLFGKVSTFGATLPGVGISDYQAFFIEIILTVGLVSTILGTASEAQNVGPLSAIAVGGYIILAGLWASPISGASMNPARSFGPQLLLFDFSYSWLYLLGPLIGSLIAVGFAYILRGRGGDKGGIKAAQGTLDQFRH